MQKAELLKYEDVAIGVHPSKDTKSTYMENARCVSFDIKVTWQYML